MFSGWKERRSQRRQQKEGPVTPAGPQKPGTDPALEAVDQRELRGRENELQQLTALNSATTLIVGHPGVGKSLLLEVAASRGETAEKRFAASEPVPLEFRSGTLQTGLLHALGVVLATSASAEVLTARWTRVFKSAVGLAADATAKDLIRGATQFMNGVVRAHLGDDAASGLETFETSFMTAVDAELAQRIDAEADSGAVHAFCMLAAQVREVVGVPVVLSLDRAERLPESDFRLLLDLLDMLPDGVHLRVGHTRAQPEDEGRIARVRAAAAPATTPGTALNVIELDGLDEIFVAGWMADRGLEPDRASGGVEEVMRVSAGYPLHVDLALGAIARGERLDQLTGDEALGPMIEQNYRALDSEDQKALMLLAAFVDPPDAELILELLEVDELDWAVRQQRLVDARFLVSLVGETPWFHELGRRLLWERVLTPAQRSVSADAALVVLLAYSGSSDQVRISSCVDLARLAPISPTALEDDEHAAAVLGLSPEHLSLLGALIEVTDTDNPTAFIGNVVDHARRRFPAPDGDLYDAAEQLRDLDLVVISENQHNQVLVPVWGSRRARALAVGRIVLEFGRVPIAAIAGAVLNGVLLPQCHPFHLGSLGAGQGGLTELSRELKDSQHDRERNLVSFHKRPGIVVRPRLGDLEFVGAISFDDVDARDRALAALAGPDAPPRVFGETWNIDELYPWPQPVPLPARRFAAAAELLTSQQFDRGFRAPSVPGIAAVTTLQEEMDLMVRTWEALRDMASPLERAVLNLTRSRGVGFYKAGSGVVWAEVVGRPEVIGLEPIDGLTFGLAARKAIDRGLGLGTGEHLGRMHYRSDGDPRNPVPELLQQTHTNLKAFNDAQGFDNRLELPYERGRLAEAITEALDRRQADAQRLLDAGLLPGPGTPLGTELTIIAVPPPGTGRYRDSWDSHLAVTERRVDGPNMVDLTLMDSAPPGDNVWEILREEIAVRTGTTEVSGFLSGLDDGIGDLLGYDRIVVTFEPSD